MLWISKEIHDPRPARIKKNGGKCQTEIETRNSQAWPKSRGANGSHMRDRPV